MKKDFTTTIIVDQSPAQVYANILDARAWWQGEFSGRTDQLNEEFTYEMPGMHFSKQKVIELDPNKRIVWLVTDSSLSFVTHQQEWTNTRMIFDIIPADGKTSIVFTHEGLVPTFECYGGCSSAWESLIQQSLFSLITKGEGVKIFG